MPPIHPMMIHFPIALIIATLVIDVLGIILKKHSFTQAATITMVGALAGAIAAVVTGLVAEDSSWIPGAAHDILETHELFGFIVLGVFAVTAVVRLALRDKLESSLRWLMLALGTIATAAVIVTAYFGGEMVFTHGAAVKAAENCVKESATETNDYEMHEDDD